MDVSKLSFDPKDKEAVKQWKHIKNVERQRENERSQKRSVFNLTMGVVGAYRNAEQFYFTYQLDFRGRAYAVPLYFNPQRRDLEKSLMMFAPGKALGSTVAMRRLALHGINCLEKDPFNKRSMKLTKLDVYLRYEWIEKHLTDICNVAEDPLQHTWWMQADSPLQFLAWCFEWADFTQMDQEGRGLEFVSYLPIALDGSSNGLQHFACLLRDERLAERVNLMPTLGLNRTTGEQIEISEEPTLSTADFETGGDIGGLWPEDLYDDVATDVRGVLSKIANNETIMDDVLDAVALAENLRQWGGVDRKFLKRNIMTLAYGSNQRGYARQYREFMGDEDNKEVMARLKQQISAGTGARIQLGLEPLRMSKHFSFLAGIVWNVLTKDGGPVESAAAAMVWFKKLADMTAGTNKSITWRSPSGFPVEVAYRVKIVKRQKLVLQDVSWSPSYSETTDTINPKKQKSTLSAHIIHSLDAAHLMRTVCELSSTGVVQHFSTAHDSFACHAADTDRLCKTIKEQLVRMYTECDLLADLEREILAKVPQAAREDLPARPVLGTLDLEKVVKVAHFSFA